MEENLNTNAIDQNDRIMAALAHVTIILPWVGVIAPIIIWATQKEKSEFVAFQALQATAYQLIMIFVWILGMGCYMCSIFGMVFFIPVTQEFQGGLAEMLGFFLPFSVFGLLLLGSIVYVVYALVGAVLVLQGRDFRYLLIGSWLEGYLKRGQVRGN